MLRALLVLLVAWTSVGIAFAQGDSAFTELEMRVTNARAGVAVVDRGASDGLLENDRVQFFPRGGSAHVGFVSRVEERNAVIKLQERDLELPLGTRGTAKIPTNRTAQPEVTAAPAVPAPTQQQEVPEHAPWKNQDQDYVRGQPLLAKVEPIHPEQRPAKLSGLIYLIADYTRSTEDDRRNTFDRLGASLIYDNSFGMGERVYFDGELNYRQTTVPDNEDDLQRRARIDRASLAFGGTRFRPARFEVGRFLQNGMPEFGVLDGVEWNTRTRGGDRYGVSAGFMPEPDSHYDTGNDLQIAGFYRWVYDESEQLAVAGGYQKSFHDRTADRDLFVFNVNYAPPEGWNFFATTWVDYYTAGDDAKSSALEFTQVYANAGRRWASGSTLNLIYTHMRFPQIDRNEFTPVTTTQLADDHNDRVAALTRLPANRLTFLRGEFGLWIDENDTGGDVELGIERDSFLVAAGHLDLAAFGTRGSYDTTLGGRVVFDTYTQTGGWRFEYELANHRIYGFSSANDDLLQHRLRGQRDWYTASGWSFSGYLEAGLWDQENALTAGINLQRSF